MLYRVELGALARDAARPEAVDEHAIPVCLGRRLVRPLQTNVHHASLAFLGTRRAVELVRVLPTASTVAICPAIVVMTLAWSLLDPLLAHDRPATPCVADHDLMPSDWTSTVTEARCDAVTVFGIAVQLGMCRQTQCSCGSCTVRSGLATWSAARRSA